MARTTTAGTASKPDTRAATAWVRMYRVGFGDFFVLGIPAAGGVRHVLVDCGVHAGDLGTLPAAVDDLAKLVDRHLSLVIVTHRHADHISGFATCAEQFAGFTVDAVWMSWWDDPRNGPAAAFQAALTAFATKAPLALAPRLAANGSDEEDVRQALRMLGNATGTDHLAAGAAGPRGAGSNELALAMLRGTPAGVGRRFRSEPVRRYYKAGDTVELPRDLADAGLDARILGPPTDPVLVAQMSSHAQEYLQLAGEAEVGAEAGAEASAPFEPRWRSTASAYPERAFAPFDSAKELEAILSGCRPDSQLEAARRADQTLNNQSLVVLFTIAGKRLLFVGDAQWGNWENLLYGGKPRPGAPPTSTARELLGHVDFYKVGHHGSTNATPIAAVEALRDGCAAMCSTEPGCYGRPEQGTEVPRGRLLEALSKKASLVRSDQVKAGDAKPTAGLPAKLPAGFSTPGALYVDYLLG
jgi:beta-lactamase superfamily II metal-dependent hydrolase